VSCCRVDVDLGRLLHLVGNRLSDFGPAFQRTDDTAADDRIRNVELCNLSVVAIVPGGLTFGADVLDDSHRLVGICGRRDQQQHDPQ
jgi:hypothetical protein